MLNFESNANELSIGGYTMLGLIIRLIIEQLVARIVAAVIGAIL
jgi:hypothetical protein